MDGYIDEFLKIEWNKPISDEQRREFCKDFDEFEANSSVFQVLHDQLIEYPVYIEEDKEHIVQQQKNNPPVYCPGYNKSLRVPTSLFSEKEMRKLFTYFLTVKKRHTVSSQGMLDEIYLEAVVEEQAKYISLAQDMWTRFNYKRAFHVHNSVEAYMRELWLKKVQAIQQFYPKAYRQTGSLHFVCENVDVNNTVHLSEDILLKKQHWSRKIKLPKRWTHHSIPISNEDLISEKDPVSCLAKTPVSADKAAWDWARIYKPDVVLTASALKALANNLPPHYMTEWNLIVTVKDIDIDGVTKKVVFIDKPLPPCTLTNMQHIQWHAKLACKMLVVRGNKRVFKTSSRRSEDVRKVSVYDDDDWLRNDSDTESFGMCSSSQSPSSSKSKVKEDVHTEAGSSNSSQANLELSSQEVNRENSQLFDYSYRLWNLSSVINKLEEKQKILRKGDTNIRPLSLIVRNKIDGTAYHFGRGSDGVVSSKVEYQEDLGAEVMSVTELVNEWLDLMIRPNSCLVRVRVSYKGEYIMSEKKKIIDVEAEALRLYQFNLKSTLITLQVLLCQLCNLNTGQYYVTHSSNYGAFAHVYTSVPPTIQRVFNLHEFCQKNWSKGITKEQHVPWKSLDMFVFTPTHLHLKRIPGTFRPLHKIHSILDQRAKLKAFKTASWKRKVAMKKSQKRTEKKRKEAEKLKWLLKKEEGDKTMCDSND